MSNRALDMLIAKEFYNYKLVLVSKNDMEKNTWNVPRYCEDIKLAISFSLKVGYDPKLSLSEFFKMTPEDICKQAYDYAHII